MEELQRVDIKLSKDVLKWAAVEAAKEGISRRQFLANLIYYAKSNHDEFVKRWKDIIKESKSE